jgi:glycosyltransferase involved in cell wall biosynthesis
VIRRTLERHLEMAALRGARGIVAATDPIKDDLACRLPDTGRAVCTITNGYDRSEFEGLRRQRKPDGAFLLVHTGGVSTSRADTSIEPFLAALAAMRREAPNQALRVRFVGKFTPDEKSMASRFGVERDVAFLPTVPRKEAHQHQLDADALLLITAPGRRSVATLKLFDYIGAGVPILALAEGNVAAEIVRKYGLGVVVKPDGPIEIAAALRDLITRYASKPVLPGLATAQEAYERRALARRLARVFDEVLA